MTASFREATRVEAVNANTYSVWFHEDWCIGTVPHGGYVTSIFLSVAKLHFDTVRAAYQQSHTIAVQLNFLRRTSLGSGTFTVSEAKLGQRTSTINIALNQRGEPTPLVVGYFTQSNIATETGISVTLPPPLDPTSPHLTSTKALREGTDADWKRHENKFSKFRKAGQHLITYVPRKGQAGLVDQWLTLASGEKFTQESLGYVVDSFPSVLENVEISGESSNKAESLARGSLRTTKSEESGNPGDVRARSHWAKLWYPTVLLNMEIKKELPKEGAEWLFSRIKAKQIRNGRMDIEIVLLDQTGDIVALSNHVALIVPAERNMVRSEKDKAHQENKL